MAASKALYRNWAIPVAGQTVYTHAIAPPVLQNLKDAGVCRRAERLYQRLDDLRRICLVGRLQPSVVHLGHVYGRSINKSFSRRTAIGLNRGA